MDESAMSAVDMLLEQHSSSLLPASSPATTPPTTGATNTSLRRELHEERGLQQSAINSTAAGAAAFATAAVPANIVEEDLLRLDGSVPSLQQQQQEQQPLPPGVLPAKKAQQPDIVRHEVRDM